MMSAPEQLAPGRLVELIPEPIPGVARSRERCIVVRRESPPGAKWIDEQLDSRMREFRDSPWWAVLPLTGGMLLIPEPLLEVRGEPSYDELMVAIEHANTHGCRTIAGLFPELLGRVLGDSESKR